MKTLYLLRHAKSSWDDIGLSDMERPLNKRGKCNSEKIVPHLFSEGWQPESVFSSPAKRAFNTISNIQNGTEEQGFPCFEFQVEKALYSFSSAEIFMWLTQLPDTYNKVTIVGHNPALTELHNQLSTTRLDNIVTCGFCAIKLPVQTWQQLTDWKGAKRAETISYIYPKMFI